MMVCRWGGKVVWGVYTHDGVQVGWEGGEGSLHMMVCRWGGKVVRGAYMQYERTLAASLSLSSPVHDSYELTGHAYDR